MQPMNHPASPDSFEHSRLADLIALHQAIATLGLAPDYAHVISQQTALCERLRDLHPTMISDQENSTYQEQILAMADARAKTLGL